MLTSRGQSYHQWGNGTEVLVMLHGWPGNSQKWEPLAGFLSDKFMIYALDHAGWGETKLKKAYTLADYAEDVQSFLQFMKIENPVFVGHSFGGRVAIKLLSMHPQSAKKLILVASAGIERKSSKVRILNLVSRFAPTPLKNILHRFFAAKDYRELSGDMRQTFLNVISENLEELLPKIKVPTLLIWGDQDHTTPLWQGKLMHRLIPNSRLAVISGGNHGLPYRKPEEVAAEIRKFLL